MNHMSNKPSALACVCRSVSGPFTQSLIGNMKILELYHDSIDLLTATKTDRSASFISNYLDITMGKSITLDYKDMSSRYPNWQSLYESMDVSFLKGYSALYIFGGIHYPQSNLTQFSERGKTFPIDDKGQLKFMQVASNVINVIAIHKAHVLYDIPLHEFSYDTDEYSTKLFNVQQNPDNYFNYHVYDIPKYGMHRLDSLQYFYQNKDVDDIFALDTEKEFDLTFGYTLYDYGNRPKYVDVVDRISAQFDKTNIFVKNAIDKDKSNVVDKTAYLDLIKKSKYTLIIPSYDEHCFSFYRFVESIFYDCLPLIHPDCNIAGIEQSFGIDISPLISESAFTESDRLNLLESMKANFLCVKKVFKTV